MFLGERSEVCRVVVFAVYVVDELGNAAAEFVDEG